MLKGQDIVVLAALMDDRCADESYAELAKRVCISASEAHASVRRLRDSALIRADRHVHRRNATEFLLHGLRYAFPLRSCGETARGIPTSYAAPVARDAFAVSGAVPVWQTSAGGELGNAVEPLYPTAPDAAAGSRRLYDRLALIDMLRGGRLRERHFAESRLEEMFS